MDPVKLNSREFLAALNLACCWMGGTKDCFQGFCAGFATGMSCVVDALNVGIGYYDAEVLGDGLERDGKIMAAAMQLIEQFNVSLEKDMVFEERFKEKNGRDDFRKMAMENYSKFVTETRRAN